MHLSPRYNGPKPVEIIDSVEKEEESPEEESNGEEDEGSHEEKRDELKSPEGDASREFNFYDEEKEKPQDSVEKPTSSVKRHSISDRASTSPGKTSPRTNVSSPKNASSPGQRSSPGSPVSPERAAVEGGAEGGAEGGGYRLSENLNGDLGDLELNWDNDGNRGHPGSERSSDDGLDDVERMKSVSRMSSKYQPSHPNNTNIDEYPLLPWLEPGDNHIPNGVEEVGESIFCGSSSSRLLVWALYDGLILTVN